MVTGRRQLQHAQRGSMQLHHENARMFGAAAVLTRPHDAR
jgi:hypothetical protein